MAQVPLAYRLLLLGLLPALAGVLYVRGQHYDPALIDFRSTTEKTVEMPGTVAGSGQAAVSEIKGIEGFRQLGRSRIYTKENLYEHVNGHAEYFISAGFAGLTVTDYVAANSKTDKAELQAEIFDMGRSIQAFGVLVDESGENARSVSVGAMAFKTSGGINFIQGRYYVKVSGMGPGAPVLTFARALGRTLPSGHDSFDIFSRLPDLGKIEKTRFVKEGYRGLDLLHNVVEREYSAGEKRVTVALMASTGQEAKKLEASFFDYFSKSDMKYEKAGKGGAEFYRVTDKYEGNWFLVPSGDALFGVFGTEDEGVVRSFGKGKG